VNENATGLGNSQVKENAKPYRNEGNSAVLDTFKRKVSFVKDATSGRVSVRIESLDKVTTAQEFSVADALNPKKLNSIASMGHVLNLTDVKKVAFAIKDFLEEVRTENLYIVEDKNKAACHLLDAFVSANEDKFALSKELYNPASGHIGYFDVQNVNTFFAREVFEANFNKYRKELRVTGHLLRGKDEKRDQIRKDINGVRLWFYCINLKGVV
jgi:hypothetical protein